MYEEDINYPLEHWEFKENIEAAYNKEKILFNEDCHLKLYWLFHFGLN
jgi:hypothetical protein